MDNNHVVFRPLGLDELDEAAALVGRIFVEREPTTRALGITSEVFMPFALAYCRRAAEEGMGVVAQAPGGGPLLGVATCLDLLEDVRERFPELEGEPFSAKLPDLAFVSRLERPFVEENGLVGGQCAHIAQVAVHESAWGQGIAAGLIARACEAAQGHGYGMVASLCTSAASAKAHEKAGFRLEKSQPYGTYEHEGRRVFADVEGNCTLMVRRFEE